MAAGLAIDQRVRAFQDASGGLRSRKAIAYATEGGPEGGKRQQFGPWPKRRT